MYILKINLLTSFTIQLIIRIIVALSSGKRIQDPEFENFSVSTGLMTLLPSLSVQ